MDLTDFALTTSGLSGSSVTSVVGGPTIYTAAVSVGSGSGTLRLDVVDDDSIQDAVTNRLGGTGVGNGNFTTGEVYTVVGATAPTGLTATAGNRQVSLAWNPSAGATGYNVKRALVSAGRTPRSL